MEIINNKIGSYKFKPAEGASKGNIVFIHGFGTNSDYHDAAAEKFINYNYYTLELPGCGYTKISDEDKKNFNLNFFVDFCINMIKELDLKKFFLVGHSMGASLAERISPQISERILGLILITPMNSSIPNNFFKLFFLFTPKNFNKTLALNNILYSDLIKTINLDVENYISNEHQYQINHLDFFKIIKKKIFSLKNIIDCRNAEKNISHATLLMVGEFDKMIPYKSAIRKIKRANKPFIQVVIFRKSAHIPFKEEPEKYYKDVIEFIET